MNMTPREATELAERIIKTWPAGPKQGIWFDVLTEHCTHDAAWAVYRQFRDTEERPPSIAGFLAVYRRSTRQVPRRAPAPADDGPVMSFDEYIATLIRSADAGDTDAARMLDLWTDNEHRGLTGSWLKRV